MEDIRARVVGSWQPAATTFSDVDGVPAEPAFGSSPNGLLIYTSDGHVAALVAHSGRRRLSVGDRLAAGTDEAADAFANFFSYGGRSSGEGRC